MSSYKTSSWHLLPLLIGLIFTATACNSKTEKRYSEDGKLQAELHYRNGQLDGVNTWYYPSGIKQLEAGYKLNKLHGKSTRWHENGRLQSESWYTDNRLDSVMKTYSVDGRLVGIENYENDTLNGPFEKWYENGNMLLQGQYAKGMMDGAWLFFYADGTIAARANFDKGAGIQKAYYPDGPLSMVIRYKNNLKQGAEEYYTPQGEIYQLNTYEQGQLVKEEVLFEYDGS